MPDFVMPGVEDRVAVLGRTGSGKTQFAVWLLSNANFDRMPWIVMNFKGDKLIDEIPGTFDLDIDERIPTAPGIYVTRPIVADKDDKEKLNEFFRRCWERENVGIYVDEGYMATNIKWFRACLTQGRSRHVPMIVLSQRPSWIDTFVWTEATYFAAFDLNREDDKILAGKMLPGYRNAKLPPYWSIWHDVNRDSTFMLKPVPDRDTLLARFRARLPTRRKAI